MTDNNMWVNMLILLLGNPSKETMDGLTDIVDGGYDVETAINMFDELIKKDKSLAPFTKQKDEINIGYKAGKQDAINEMLKIIDKLDDKNIGLPDWSHEYEAACRDFRTEVETLKGDEHEDSD